MGVRRTGRCAAFDALPSPRSHKPRAPLLTDAVSCFVCTRPQGQTGIPIGSYLVFPNVHVAGVTTFPPFLLDAPEWDGFGEARRLGSCVPPWRHPGPGF